MKIDEYAELQFLIPLRYYQIVKKKMNFEMIQLTVNRDILCVIDIVLAYLLLHKIMCNIHKC